MERKPSKSSPENFPLELFFSALNAAVDAIVITDIDSRILWVNNSFKELTGYSYSEVVGKRPSILKSGVHNDEFYKSLWGTINSGKTWQGEMWNKKKNKSRYLEEQTITPVKDENDIVTHFIAIKRDVTEKKQIQKQLQHSQKMEDIGRMTGGISHNFNNKLASILGYTEIIAEKLHELPELPALQKNTLIKYNKRVFDAGISAKQLVEQLKTFCREKAGEFHQISIKENVHEILTFAKAALPSTIEIFEDIENDLPSIESDTSLLHQLVMALITNAVTSMKSGGKLTLNVSRQEIKNQYCNSCNSILEGDYIQLSVSDTGIGIPPENFPKLFLPFFTTNQMEGKTGMGLSVLHGLIHEQHGHVTVKSELNKGSTFSLLFRYSNNVDLSSEKQNKDNAELTEEPAEKHILVVDDNPVVIELLRSILVNEKYKLSTAINGQEALKIFMDEPTDFNLILTDQTMPEFTGVELAKVIKTISKEVPIILMSGYKESDIELTSEERSLFYGFIEKPFKIKDLMNCVLEIMET